MQNLPSIPYPHACGLFLWSFFLQVVATSHAANPLGGSSENRSSRSDVLGLVLSLGLGGLGSLGDRGLLLGDLLGSGNILGRLLGGGLRHSALGGLVLRLRGGPALDGSTELGERTLAGLFLAVSGGRRLLALAKDEGQRRLALLLDILLGLAVGGGDLDGLSRDGGRVGDVDSKGGGGLDGRDHRSSSVGGNDVTLLGGLGSLVRRLGDIRLLLLLGEDIAEEAVALGDNRLLLGALSGGSLSLNSGLGGSLSINGGGLLNRGSLRLGNRLGGLGGGDLLSLGLFLLLLLAEAEERGTLAAGRAALGLLGLGLLLGLVLGSLAFLGRILSLGRLLGLGNVISRLVLLGNDRSRLEALDGALVDLGLGDGGGELLGLGDLEPQLGNPAVTLGGGGSLEAVLVTLGGEVELVGAVDFGLAGISLWKSGSECRQLSHVLWNSLLTRLMMLVGAFLSPTKRRPLPVWEAQAMLL